MPDASALPPAEPPMGEERRRRWMAVLAKATRAELEAAFAALADPPRYTLLRRPETGLAMVRGRIGGSGAPFNLGEMTVTRCAVALAAGGAPGVAYLAGRDTRRAELAAVFDALLQQGAEEAADAVAGLASEQRRRREAAHAELAPTKVEFFTMVRE